MKVRMQSAYVVEFETPKKIRLRGLWYGPQKPKRVIVFVHGLGGSVFSMRRVLDSLISRDTAVFTFNNRGHDLMSDFVRTGGKAALERAGKAHEVFTECVDDIQGAVNFVQKKGIKDIFLTGHSTGCQKSIYWASQKNGGRAVKGIILLAPISDYEAELHRKGKVKIARAEKYAKALVRKGKKHELLPSLLWHEVMDAQRFLSLYTKVTPENTFPYGRPEQAPKALASVKVPVLVCWGEKDEYADRLAEEVAEWFEAHLKSPYRITIIPNVGHHFKGEDKLVVKIVRNFMSAS